MSTKRAARVTPAPTAGTLNEYPQSPASSKVNLLGGPRGCEYWEQLHIDGVDPYVGYSTSGGSGGIDATVLEDPSLNASDVEINRTGSQELVIWGTGFNNMTAPVMDFDPPLDSLNLNVKVSSREGWLVRIERKYLSYCCCASVVPFDGVYLVVTTLRRTPHIFEPVCLFGRSLSAHGWLSRAPAPQNAVVVDTAGPHSAVRELKLCRRCQHRRRAACSCFPDDSAPTAALHPILRRKSLAATIG